MLTICCLQTDDLIFRFCVPCMFVFTEKTGCELPSLPWPSSNFSSSSDVFFLFSSPSHLRERNVPSFFLNQALICVTWSSFSQYLCRIIKHLQPLPRRWAFPYEHVQLSSIQKNKGRATSEPKLCSSGQSPDHVELFLMITLARTVSQFLFSRIMLTSLLKLVFPS